MFWDNFVTLCAKRDKSTTAVILELGLSRGSVTYWKTGATPNNATLYKIANYFGVSTEELLSKEIPFEQSPKGIDHDFYNKLQNLNEAEKLQVRDYLDFLLSKHQDNE